MSDRTRFTTLLTLSVCLSLAPAAALATTKCRYVTRVVCHSAGAQNANGVIGPDDTNWTVLPARSGAAEYIVVAFNHTFGDSSGWDTRIYQGLGAGLPDNPDTLAIWFADERADGNEDCLQLQFYPAEQKRSSLVPVTVYADIPGCLWSARARYVKIVNLSTEREQQIAAVARNNCSDCVNCSGPSSRQTVGLVEDGSGEPPNPDDTCEAIPTLSQWGLIILGGLVLISGTLLIKSETAESSP